MRATGTYVRTAAAGERFDAFVPAALPPSPPLALSHPDQESLEQARDALRRLDTMSDLLPDPGVFLYTYVRKEALVSSQIEGTQSSLADLLLYESDQQPGVPLDDVREVSDYVAALDHGLTRMRGGFPLSLRLLREIHAVLLRSGRGHDKAPGEFRRIQVWVGGARPSRARFVPPPADQIPDCMAALEKFLHDDPVATPTLVKAALAHVQFETIHPFLDGNGRLGRLLIALLLVAEGALREPTLYLSLYFKTHRPDYYDHLQRVRTEGDWESWVGFFARGVVETADEALHTAKRILTLFDADRRRLAELGRAAPSAFRVHERLQLKPITTVRDLAAALELTYPTVAAALDRMVALGIVRELTGHARNRVFAYSPYIDLLSEGTAPFAPASST